MHPPSSIDETIQTTSRRIPQSTTESVTVPELAAEPEGMPGSSAEPEVVRESTKSIQEENQFSSLFLFNPDKMSLVSSYRTKSKQRLY
jgi:hypothetical protein